jgi:hypothetical protein
MKQIIRKIRRPATTDCEYNYANNYYGDQVCVKRR